MGLLFVKLKHFCCKYEIKNIFRQNPIIYTSVDKVINIIPIVSLTFLSFINKLVTSYPLLIVNNWKGCPIQLNLVDLGYTN
jgi:hypothetical protein